MQTPHPKINLLLSLALSVAVQALLLEAYGFSKCIFNNTDATGANCTRYGIVNLTAAIDQLPNRTSWLDASHNSIRKLEVETFSHLSSLQRLSLASNQIGEIQEGAFRHLEGLNFLDLSNNRIHSLDPLYFAELQSLQVLQISYNNIYSLQTNSLKPFVSLQELDLSFNLISNFWLVAEAIQGLTKLSTLHLACNGIYDLKAGQNLTHLPNIQHLSFAKNNINILDFTSYVMPSLRYLDVTRNNMTAVNASSFHNVPNLVEVAFDENPLHISQIYGFPLTNLTALHWSSMRPAFGEDISAACQLLQTLPNLNLLDIQHSKIRSHDLNFIGNCTNSTIINLSTSSLGKLEKNAFQSFRFLETLYLNKCKLTQIATGAFDNLKYLRTLVIERNRLKELEKLVFRPLKRLKNLDLSKNFLTLINPKVFLGLSELKNMTLRNCKIVIVTRDTFMYVRKLVFLDLSSNSLNVIKERTFEKLNKLEILLLTGNRISSVTTQGFKGLHSLRYLSLSRNHIYKLDPDRFRYLRGLSGLDLSMNKLTSWNKFQNPSPFQELRSLKLLDLSLQEKSDQFSISNQLFIGLQSLEILNLHGNPSMLFQNLSLHPLGNLTELDLSDMYPSGLFRFSSDLLQSTRKLKYLKLDSNSFNDLPEDAFANLDSLEILSLRDNTLTNISEKLVGNLTALTYLDVYMNPLLCSCENVWFQNWSTSNPHVQVPLIQSFSCFGKFEDTISFTEQDLSFCNNDIPMILFLCTFTITLLTMIASILTVKLRWVLIYSYCMLRAWCEKKFHKEVRAHQFDAFVSCCAEDEPWVMENLLLNLETLGPRTYRLCFKPRDFLPGEFYIDSLQDAINNSRKTLCVVSSEYLNSDWCRLEIEMACSRMFYQHEDVLIVVFLEDIPNYRLSTYHRLRRLLRNHAYITWPEDPAQAEPFWVKLRAELDSGVTREQDMQLGITI